MSHLRRQESGFTLVEMVITAAVISLVATAAAMNFPGMLSAYRLQQGTAQLLGAIRAAQVKAVQEGRPWRVKIDPDGRGYTYQFASGPGTDPATCSDPDWENGKHEPLPPTVSIDISAANRLCLGFTPAGRTAWTNPIAMQSGTTLPYYGGAQAYLRLADGIALTNSYPTSPLTDVRTISWYGGIPVVTMDIGEVRYLSSFCIGMYTYPPSYRYPSNISVEGSVDLVQWRQIYNGAGPGQPGAGRHRKCFPVTVNHQYRYLRMTFTRNGNYIVLDEIEMGDLKLLINGARGSRQLTVSPVTGRVQVEEVGP